MAAIPGSYRFMAWGLVFDSEDEAKHHHEEQHRGMVRKATGDTSPSQERVTAKKRSAYDVRRAGSARDLSHSY